MKKKLFATLGALCLGVILCVSSVFAVNWWYSIQDTDAANTITFGKKITLSVAGGGSAATGAYQNSVITFNDVTVKAPKWDEQTITGGGSHTNGTLPTFKLVITSSADMTNVMTATVAVSKMVEDVKTPINDITPTITGTTITIDNIQNVNAGGDFIITLTLTVEDDLPSTLSGSTFSFTAEIVAVGVQQDDTNLDDEVQG